MKRYLKIGLSIMFICSLFIMSYSMNTQAADIVYSGTSGDLNWSIDESGHFILTGTGDYNYFDRNWEVYNDKIVTAEIDVKEITDLDSLFKGCSNLKSVDLENTDTSKVRSTASMFEDCTSLITLDFSNFDTRNVINMWGMFSGCSDLENLNLKGMDTSNVTSMSYMFSDCSSLETLDISFFDTEQVIYMNSMFSGCNSLGMLDVSNWDTSNAKYMDFMFSGCSSITEIDVSNWDTFDVEDMSAMFQNCYNLELIDVSNWNTSKVYDMSYMFSYCSNVQKIDVSNWNTSSLEDMEMMFNDCTKLTILDVSNFDTSNVINMNSTFCHCENVVELDVSNFNTSQVTDMGCMFLCCEKVQKLDVSEFDTRNVISMESMFRWCDNLISIDVSKFDTGNVENAQRMFSRCGNLQELDLHNFDLSCLSDENDVNLFENSFNLKTIYTPLNLQVECLLPQITNATWQDVSGNIYSALPTNNTQSILLTLFVNGCDHLWESKGTIVKEATCIEDGLKVFSCAVCGEVKEEVIDRYGHDFSTTWTVDKKATTSANGSKSKHCTQCEAKTSITAISKASNVKLGTATYVYNGKMRSPSVVIKDSKGNVISSVNYTLSKPSGRKNVGKYTYKITFKNQYSGTKSLTLTINPKGTSISGLTNASKAFTVKWKMQSEKMASTRITGYQIQYSTSKQFTNPKSKLATGYGNTSKKIVGLKAKTTYYVRVRTYKNVTVNGKIVKLYSGWSTVKSVKTK